MKYAGPDDHDADLFDDTDQTDVVDCPGCGGEIYAEAEQCPECGTWLAMHDRSVKRPARSRLRYRWWTLIVVILLATIAVVWVLWGW
jgi:hypothetical protein